MYKYIIALLLFLAPGLAPSEENATLRVKDVDAAISALKEQGIEATEIEAPRVVPDIRLICPETVIAGERLVKIVISEPNDFPEDLVKLDYQYFVKANSEEITELYPYEKNGEKGVIFASPSLPGSIDVTLDINASYGNKVTIAGKNYFEENIEFLSPKPRVYTIAVTGSGPTPPGPGPTPPPGPDPTPTPSFPDSVFGMDKVAYEAAKAQVSSPYLVKAGALADSFETIAGKVRTSAAKHSAGVALDSEDIPLNNEAIRNESQKLNREKLGSPEVIEAWKNWNKVYGDAFYKLASDQKLRSYQDWATVFQETANGLRVIR